MTAYVQYIHIEKEKQKCRNKENSLYRHLIFRLYTA